MATDSDDRLREGLLDWLAGHRGPAEFELGALTRPSSGYSAETIIAPLRWADDRGVHADQLVVRLAPRQAATFAGYDLVAQWQAQTAAARAGVPVPSPVLETDPRWVGAPFIIMTHVDGHIVGAVPAVDPWLVGLAPERRSEVHDALLSVVAAVHGAAIGAAPAVPRRDNKAELDHWERYLTWSSGGRPVPALAEGLAWCRRNQPEDEPAAVLLWGDVRLENMVFGDDCRPRAVLDWDMTSIGAPQHDLAWFTSLATTAERLFGRRPEGFPDREETVARFTALTDRSVRDLEWYETLAMVKSTAILTRISLLQLESGRPPMLPVDDNPVLDLVAERLR